jgi:hypothetical protein
VTRLALILVTVLVTCFPAVLRAHALDPGYLNLEAMGQERWRVTWRIPDVNGRPMPIVTCHRIFPPFGIRVRPNEGTDNEAIKIQRRTDFWHPDGA